MPRRVLKHSLIEHRPWLLASMVMGASYFFAQDDHIGELWLMLWKGSAVGLLAVYAAARTKGADGRLLTLVMALGALGDAVLVISLIWGGVLFALGHVFAIALYLRHRRTRVVPTQLAAGIALLLATPIIAAGLTYPQDNWLIATAYAALVGAMAAAAWTSRFPRYRVGVGAVLFLISDLVLFARAAEQIPALVSDWTIWPLYYVGQLMIATGVVRTLRQGRA